MTSLHDFILFTFFLLLLLLYLYVYLHIQILHDDKLIEASSTRDRAIVNRVIQAKNPKKKLMNKNEDTTDRAILAIKSRTQPDFPKHPQTNKNL